MSVRVEKLTGLERKITVSIPFEEIDDEKNKRLKKLAKTAKIDGFRQGKIPESALKRHFGGRVEEEALNDAVQQSFAKALAQENLSPAGSPNFKFEEKYAAGKPFVFEVEFEIFPEISLLPFSDLIIEKAVSKITEEDLEKTLEGMQREQTIWQESLEADALAKEGDKVWINFEGKVNGETFEGSEGNNMPLVLGSHSLISGFEEGLINAAKNQDLTLNLTFPENYHAKNLAGKNVQFTVHVNKIEQAELPVLDDAFAEKFGIKEGGIAALRAEAKQALEKQLDRALRSALKQEVMKKLYESYKSIEAPKVLVKREAKYLLDNMKQQLKRYQPQAGLPDFTLKTFEERAKERVILGLTINEILQKEKLKADPKNVRILIEEAAEGYEHPEKIVNYYYQDKARLAQMEALAVENQLVEKILSEAMLVETPANAGDLLSKVI